MVEPDVLSTSSLVAILIALISVPMFFLALIRVRAGHRPSLRPLSAFDKLSKMGSRAAESGRVLHVGLGTGGISGPDTAVSLAGLSALKHLADKAAACEARLVVTVADATLLPAAQEVLRQAYARRDKLEVFSPSQVRLLAPDPTAYAAGVMGVLEGENPVASVTIGAFGEEFLLIGETGTKEDIEQVAGTGDPAALTFMHMTAGETLIGEEMFAADAYLGGSGEALAGLMVQDWWRYLVVAAILLGVLWKTLV